MTSAVRTLRRFFKRNDRPTVLVPPCRGPGSRRDRGAGGADLTDSYLDDPPSQRWKVQLLCGYAAR